MDDNDVNELPPGLVDVSDDPELQKIFNSGWTLMADDTPIGTINADTATGYTVTPAEGLPDTGFSTGPVGSLQEGIAALTDLWNALMDRVDRGELEYDHDGFRLG